MQLNRYTAVYLLDKLIHFGVGPINAVWGPDPPRE